MRESGVREGEIVLPFDPGVAAADATVMFIGRLRSPWHERSNCPHSLTEARERGGGGTAEIDAPFRAGLAGLERHSHVIVLYWLDRARRDLIVQRPHHASDTNGVFALRSPVRPNPIGFAVVRLLKLDAGLGRIAIDAIDCLDGTPLVDLKPYIARIDAVPEASRD